MVVGDLGQRWERLRPQGSVLTRASSTVMRLGLVGGAAQALDQLVAAATATDPAPSTKDSSMRSGIERVFARTTVWLAAATLMTMTTAVGLASPADAQGDHPPRPAAASVVDASPTDRPRGTFARLCIAGLGGDCDEWYENFYGNKVLVTDDLNDYVKSKHGISKHMIRWVIRNGPRDNAIPVHTTTRQGYRTPVRRMDCDPRCHDAGVQVNIWFIVEWAGHGAHRGELTTMYCRGHSGLCPKWIRAL